jgi:nucleoside-diphosphate-sugar epimerase
LRTLIIGSTGYVGKSLLARLAASGLSPATLDRDKKNRNVLVLRADGSTNSISTDQVGQSIRRLGVSTIVNLFASTSKGHEFKDADELLSSNIVIPTLVASTLENLDIHFIQMGTYSYRSSNSEFHPQTLYSATKFATEHLLNFYASRFENLRISNVHCYDIYGPNHHKAKLIPMIVEGLLQGQPTFLSFGEQKLAPIHILDVVRALETLISFGPQPEKIHCYDLYGPEVLSLRELAERVANVVGSDPDLLVFNRPYRWREIMDFSPCHKLPPGYSPEITLEDGISSVSGRFPLN